MDRAESFNGCGGPLGAEVRGALLVSGSRAKTVNYIYGLGGRDVRVEDLAQALADMVEVAKTGDAGEPYRYLSVRE